jgi:hypothetical protein
MRNKKLQTRNQSPNHARACVKTPGAGELSGGVEKFFWFRRSFPGRKTFPLLVLRCVMAPLRSSREVFQSLQHEVGVTHTPLDRAERMLSQLFS